MLRRFAAVVVVLFVAGLATADDKPAKNQMVKGTIKLADASKDLLIVKQKLKNGDVVDRELSITASTDFVITIGNEKKEVSGKEGLVLLEDAEGSSVSVKCDKDVNVLKVTVTIKKK
jgi:hypothetical protein